jgi:hypothetical protein
VILSLLGLGLNLLVAPTALQAGTQHKCTAQLYQLGAQERLDGVCMSEVGVWLVCCPCPGLEIGKRREGYGWEDGGSEKGTRMEGGGKWKRKERDEREHGGESRNESGLEMS